MDGPLKPIRRRYPVVSLQLDNKRRGSHREDLFPANHRKTNSLKILTTLKHQMAVQSVLDLLKARIKEPLTLEKLATSAGLSRTYFSHVFRKIVGMSLQEYVGQVRVEKAKDLLRDLNLTVKQVAYEAGFRDPDYFCRTFKKALGTTPTDWRLKELKNLPSENKHGKLELERRK